MVLVRAFKRNQGMRINTDGKSIDVVVLKIEGRRSRKKVWLNVYESGKMKTIHFNEANTSFKIEKVIQVGMCQKQNSSLSQAHLYFSAPKDYKFERLDNY